MNEKELIIAAKIYPLKILYDGNEQTFITKFEGLFGMFYNIAILKGILFNAKGFEESYSIIRKAEEISFYEHIRGKQNDFLNLKSVFSRVSISNEDHSTKETFYKYDDNPLRSNPQELTERCKPHDSLENYLIKFEALLYKLQEKKQQVDLPKNINDFEISFDSILYKYLWCVASSKNEGEDISLYDHSKVMAAITSCLVCNKESFIMGICDFSGIQKYIFSVASTNGSGVSKRLRARSFYVDLLIRTFARYVVDEFNIGPENILLETGGKFYVLLPNRPESEELLNRIKNEIDEFLYSEYKGQVSVNFAWSFISDRDLENYSDVITGLTNKLKEQKQHSFSRILKDTDANEWNENSFILENDLGDKHLCDSCRNVLISKDKDVCPACTRHFKIGEKLPKAGYFVYSRGSEKEESKYKIFRDYCIEITTDLSNYTNDAYLIESLKDIQEDEALTLPIKRIYMTNHVPVDKSGILSFSDIAGLAKGSKRLAVLKMDVDTLGYVFSDGLRENDRHYGTISRIGTMSRLLNVFFCGKIQEMLETEKYRNVYSVFSGGDDLFLIGPWDVMPELAIDINREFREFTKNDELTVSAGISVFGAKEHIARMAEQSEEELEDAKNSEGILPYPEHHGRNRVKFMGDVFSWEDFDYYKTTVKTYIALLNNKKQNDSISVNILRRLMQYSDMYRKFLCDNNSDALMFIPMLNYDKNRNHPGGKNSPEEVKWFNNRINAILDEKNILDNNINDITKELFFTKTIVKWALDLSKGER